MGSGLRSVWRGFWAVWAVAVLPPLDTRDLTLMTEPEVVRALESRGLSLGDRLEDPSFRKASNAALAGRPRYGAIAQWLIQDLEQIQASDPELGVGMGKDKRLFDPSFLVTERARLVLVGVANRMDRAYVDPEHCGEIRLIYRLAYRVESHGEEVASRLPMTVNLVYHAKRPGLPADPTACGRIASRWKLPQGASAPTAANLETLVGPTGPLSPDRFPLSALKALEVNLQSVRWPSAVRPDFGGYSQYHLRVFEWDAKAGVFRKGYLENQLDIGRLKQDQILRGELKRWILTPGNLQAIDRGTAVFPDKFLAKAATSVTPGGLTRLQNRPVLKVFREADFQGVSFSKLKRVKSAASLLRRLDDLSCVGCHQSRSIAGFHLMGQDPLNKYPGNSVRVAASAHALADLPRRRAVIEAFATGERPHFERGWAERADEAPGFPAGVYGAHCSLGRDPSFSEWSCGAGLECRNVLTATFDEEIGQCFPAREAGIGDPCESGQVRENADPRLDVLIAGRETGCGRHLGLRCVAEKGGFPGGMCALEDCQDIPAGGVCGSLPTAKPGFNSCLGAGKNFVECIRAFAAPRGLRGCDAKNPCRDDYICAEAQNGKGACVPPYFLFQFRVDGHPVGFSDSTR